jgi:tight adherence protein C
MMLVVLCGIGAGLGLWLAVSAVRPRPVPLAAALAALQPSPARPAGGRTVTAALRLLERLGARTAARDQQLALAGSSPAGWARDKLVATGVGFAAPLAGWALLATVGVAPPAAAMTALALVGAAAGWWWTDARLTERVTERRQAFAHALSSYLDLVNVILAGGGGVETALTAAADAGDGFAFTQIRGALERAQRIGQPLWQAFDDLGVELGVPELRELAASLGLAGSQGARIRASLQTKADTLRRHQLAATEADAEAATERMNIPTAVLLLGFLLFILFPAVSAITGVSTDPCLHTDGTSTAGSDCPPATDPPTSP